MGLTYSSALRLIAAIVLAVVALALPVAASAAFYAYGIDSTGVFQITPATGATVKVGAFTGGAITGNIAAASQRASDGLIFFLNDPNTQGNARLYSWNPASPGTQPVSIGNTGNGVPYFPRFGFNAAGTLYAINTASTGLYTISTTTGAAAKVATLTGNTTSGGDLAFGPDGVLYQVSGDVLYTVPLAGGALTTVGTISGVTETLTGIAFDNTGNLIALGEGSANNAAPTNLYKIAKYTSAPAATLLANTCGCAPGDLASMPILISNVGVSKNGASSVSVNALVAYTIVIANGAGGVAGTGTTFNDPVPANLTLEGAPTCAASGGAVCPTIAVSGQTISGTIATLPANSSITITVRTKATAAGSYTNTVTIVPPSGTADPNATTASASTTVANGGDMLKTVTNTTQGGSSGSATNANPGDILEYDITYTNHSGLAVGNLVLADTVPADQTYYTGTACPTTYPTGITNCAVAGPAVGGTGNVAWTFTGTLAAGAAVTVKLFTKLGS